MRRLVLAALLAALPLAASAVEIPAAGLPAGRVSAAPMLDVAVPSVGTFGLMRTYALSLGDSLPNRAAWEALPKDAAIAGAPLAERLPAAFWADAYRLDALPPARAAQMREQFLAAHRLAAGEAGRLADVAVVKLEEAIKAGAAGGGDLSILESRLRALSVYGGRAAERYDEVRRASEEQRRIAVERALAEGKKLEVASSGEGSLVPGSEPPRRPFLSKAAANRLGRAATWAGAGALGGAAAASVHPALLHGAAQAPGILTWAGAAGLSLGRLLGPARASVSAAAASGEAAAPRLPGWLSNRLGTLRALWHGARDSAAAERRLEAPVGDGRLGAFITWVRAGARTAAPWFGLSLLGMLAGSVAMLPLKLFTMHAAVAATSSAAAAAPDVSAVAGIPFWTLANGYAAPMLLTDIVLLGGAFKGARWAAARVFGGAKAGWIAGAVALAAAAALLAATGYPLALAGSVLGIEAVLIALYARTGTLLAPGLARLGFALMSIESTRMMVFLQLKPSGTLPGLPHWAGLAVGGMLLAYALVTPLKAQLARLKDLGAWWAKRTGDAPKPAGPMLSAGLMWAVPVYLSMEAAFRLFHFLIPQSEPTPEILGRMLLMPLDVIAFNFVIVAALEEWVFRRGVFAPIVAKIKKWGAPSKWWFWPAAVASALIFSGAHYVDWGALMGHGGTGAIGESLGGAYAFTWASFLARAVGGVMLAWLYAASGSLLLPMIAHFGSNMLEGLGMRYGLWPFLCTIAVILAAQRLKAARVPKP